MKISVFDLFKIGIGPSSSHTVGPMRAAMLFVTQLGEQKKTLKQIESIKVELYGSLGATGRGHGTDKAVLMGLEGETPDQIDPDSIEDRLTHIREKKILLLPGKKEIRFEEKKHLLFHRSALPEHPNGMAFTAFNQAGEEIIRQVYYSIGGGFIMKEGQKESPPPQKKVPFPFHSSAELLKHCQKENMSICQIMLENEKTWRPGKEIKERLLHIRDVMIRCIEKGCQQEGILPGGLKIKRRAPAMYQMLTNLPQKKQMDPFHLMNWVNLYALAVNEENAGGGRIVTAPTNGAAGIIPAVLQYYQNFCWGNSEEKIVNFFLTAGAIGIFYKENASISGAEVGCQGEVGVACSMAAGALTEVMEGSPDQVENAAEIGMEHNLGLTCDPIGGLVQVPCIERNAMGASKAINATRLALSGDGSHFVSLDKVIKTMRDTGADMKSKYKETARGGLALNVVSVSLPEC